MKYQAVFSFRLVNRGQVGGDFFGGVSIQRRTGTVELGEGLGLHAGFPDAMGFFGRDKPPTRLFAHDGVLAINQSANGQPALVSFGDSRHYGKVPTPGMEGKIVFAVTDFPKPASAAWRLLKYIPPSNPAMI
jgi:hypothetical protein